MTNDEQAGPGSRPPADEPGSRPPADEPGSQPPADGPDDSAAAAKRKRLWWIVGAAVAAVVVIVVLIWALSGGSEEAPVAEMVAVPDVVGMTSEEATTALTEAGLEVGEIAEEESADATAGTVLSQDPESGTEVESGTSVDLVVAAEVAAVAVPDVVGMSEATAKSTLAKAGLEAGEIAKEESADATAGTVLSQDPESGTEVESGTSVDLVVAIEVAAVPVPDVTGMSQADAVSAIEGAGFVARIYVLHDDKVPEGTVIEQEPAAGTELEAGGTVGIRVSAGPQPPPESDTVVVPDLAGQSATAAAGALEKLGLVPQIFDVYHDAVPEGDVAGQFPAAGTEVLKGSAIAVVASKGPVPPGPEAVEVPNVIGMTAADAVAAIENAGLGVIPLTLPKEGVAEGTVFAQLPEAGTVMHVDSYMVVFVSGVPTAGLPPSIEPYITR